VPRVVLVTGVSRYLGARVARVLQADPDVERVIGVDVVPPPEDLGGTDFVRADIRNPVIAKVISSAEVDTVVHLAVVASPLGAGGRSSMKEINVIGTMQLLAACQKSPSVQRLVVRSSAAVYGASPRDPALFSEDMEPRGLPRSGYAKDVFEVEGYVRGFGRRRPDVDVTLLRFANFLGPTVDNPFTRYFTMPVVPTVLGYDPRLQFLHEDDGREVLRRVVVEHHPGTFNVAGDGVLLLSQAARRAGRPTLPIPAPTTTVVGQMIRRAGLVDVSPEQLGVLMHGRAVDTTRLKRELGCVPAHTTAQAFDAFLAARGTGPVTPARAAEAERRLAGMLPSEGGSDG
jgi:UDP-glucose 4-epimerase